MNRYDEGRRAAECPTCGGGLEPTSDFGLDYACQECNRMWTQDQVDAIIDAGQENHDG